MVVGSSTHNETIECLWRDVQRCVAVLFGDLFRSMEDDGILNSLNEVDLFCLHAVFLPRINSALNSFVECWNNHPLSSEHNLTPNQLFIHGALSQDMIPTLPVVSCNARANLLPSANDAVPVPRSSFSPCKVLQYDLTQVNFLCVTDDFGYSLFQRVCHLVGQHVRVCNNCVC